MSNPPPFMPDEDYEAIEAAVMESARGRWFLAEFARRNRTADTALLLVAIERLEGLLSGREPELRDPRPHAPLEATALVTSADSELFAIEPDGPPAVTHPATAEAVAEVAWVDEDTSEPAESATEVVQLEDAESLIWSPPTQPTVEVVELDDVLPDPICDYAPLRTLDVATDPPVPESAVEETVVEEAPVIQAPPLEPEAAADPSPRPSLQSAMLAAVLAQAEGVLACTPAAGDPHADFDPVFSPVADPAEIDALSFEEKSVYFA